MAGTPRRNSGLPGTERGLGTQGRDLQYKYEHLAQAGAFVFWYRATYNVLPGQGASTRVHWCGRDYEWTGTTMTWAQASAQEHTDVEGPIELVGH
jgi:hypothetical protein